MRKIGLIFFILLLVLPGDKRVYPTPECWNLVKRTGKAEGYLEYYTGKRMVRFSEVDIYF